MKRNRLVALAAAVVAVATFAPVQAAVDKSDNVRKIATFKYTGVDPDNPYGTGGTDIAWKGDYVYAMQQGRNGGVHVFDVSTKVPRKISFIECGGTQNDVAVVRPGLIALGYHSTSCEGAAGGGVHLINVRNPRNPKFLGFVNTPGGTHTLTVYPGEPIIYASPGGLLNGGGVEQIIDVSSPRFPRVAATFKPNEAGCHDLTFDIRKSRKIAVCAGLGETQIWDVSNPLQPATISHIVNPLINFHHSAAITSDGDMLAIGDENITVNECLGGPTGAVFVYDISDPAVPMLQGYHGINRGPLPVSSAIIDDASWCTAHLFNFVPGTRTLVSSWYGAGMNVVDFSNPLAPEEVAFYTTDSVNYWSAYWYRGRVWANDRRRGALDVFTIGGLGRRR